METISEIRHNIKQTFKGLSFIEESHKYLLDGKPLSLSVSKVVDLFVHKTDFKHLAYQSAIKKGISQQDVQKSWDKKRDDAALFGTQTHSFGEKYAYNNSLIPSNGHEVAIVKFWSELPDYIIPVFTELEMYHQRLLFGGTADNLFYNIKTRMFIITDYKTNEDLHKNFAGKRLKYPFNTLLDCPLNKYKIQLNLYQILFEQTKYRVSKRKIIWLLPSGNYQLYDVDDYTTLLRKELRSMKSWD